MNAPLEKAAPRSAQAIAETCVAAMLSLDRVSRTLGMQLTAVGPGHATLAMTVEETMLNGFGACHGGMIFTLADTALACACNSHGERSLAHHCSIVYLRPVLLGEKLTARAIQRARAGRSDLYDVSVTNEAGEAVGEFFGHARVVASRPG